jgi:PAS domain S-box-containing protein
MTDPFRKNQELNDEISALKQRIRELGQLETASRQAEETLRKSETRFREMFDDAPVGYHEVDTEGRVTRVNRTELTMLGYSAEEMLGRHVSEFIDENDISRKAVSDKLAGNLAPGHNYERTYCKKDGTRISVFIQDRLLRDIDGKITGIRTTLQDITERKRADEALRKSEANYRQLFDSSPAAIYQIDFRTGKLLKANEVICEYLGCSQEEITSITPYDIMTKESQKLFLERLNKMAIGDQVPEDPEYEIIDKNGKRRWLQLNSKNIYDSEGLAGADVVAHDITALKRAEEKYRSIFSNAVMGIFQSTPEGRVISANPAFARILGYESPEAVLNAVTDMARQMYVYPEQRSDLLNLMNEQGTIQGHEVQFFRKDGSIVWTNVNGRAVRGNRNKLLYYEGIIQDITDRKVLEFQLRQAQKMEAIGTLAGGIAHEFNNILSAIMGYTDMALGKLNKKSPIRRYLGQAYKAGERARDLVKQILTFSRQSEEKLRPLRISLIVKEVLKLMRASLPSTITIRQDIQSDLDTVLADPAQIHQIMMNLCTNAAYAMRETKGELKVSLVPVEIKPRDPLIILHGLTPGMYLKLTVSDTGAGIAPEIISRIFDPFFTTRRPGEGSGMGLSVLHGIVKICHGAITVESEMGKGTEFHVYLPLHRETGGKLEVEAVADIPGGKERILFVDDEEVLVQLGKDMLSGLGYEVIEKTGSVEALELFRARPDRFDLVITDMTMPNMTGIELARELMLIRPGIPVILCTGFGEAITLERVKSVGLRELILKPIIRRQIAEAVRRALEITKE